MPQKPSPDAGGGCEITDSADLCSSEGKRTPVIASHAAPALENPLAPQDHDASFWRSVKQSMRGEEHDYTSLPLKRAVILLSVPMVLELVMESAFALVDVFWVSH